MAPLRPLNHWILQDDRIAREFDGVLKLSPYYDPVRLGGIQSEISFFASLISNVDSPVGQIAGDFNRNSQGVYRAPMGQALAIAGDDVARHEYSQAGQPIGLLLEPAITNKCINYNANPDAALSNHTVIGDGIFSRVQDAEILATSGLSQLCTSGFVFKADNTNGSGNLTIWVNGSVGNTNEHTCSVFARKDPASIGGGTFLQLEGAGNVQFTNTALYERVVLTDTPIGVGNQLGIIAQPGAIAYFVLNQLEESQVESSAIITVGAATSRAVDQLTYPTVDSVGNPIINQTEGMHAITWRPQFDRLEGVLGSQRLTSAETAWLFYDNQANGFLARSGASTDALSVLTEPLAHGKDYVVAMHWSGAEFAVGHKADGVWVWSAPLAYSGINDAGTFTIYDLINSTLEVPGNSRNVYIWRKDEGQSWLEQLFAGVAN